MCEQHHHGVVACALGWACWKTYVGRPEGDSTRQLAMSRLGNGLHDAGHNEAALSVRSAELAMERRLGRSEESMLVIQANLTMSYEALGRSEEALSMRRDVYSGHLKLFGEEDRDTLLTANNYASSLVALERCEEAKALMHRTVPVARRVLGENDENLLKIRWTCAQSLYEDPAATPDDLREAVTTLEETARTARRVLGGANPTTRHIEMSLREAQAALRARETPPPGSA